ncbi:uncharacterized protein [Argopecten irradians]|uniref:uncharacterized protein n=1 Tax=Argopecten irradians TaxID=31199 RepID=UPI00371A37F0
MAVEVVFNNSGPYNIFPSPVKFHSPEDDKHKLWSTYNFHPQVDPYQWLEHNATSRDSTQTVTTTEEPTSNQSEKDGVINTIPVSKDPVHVKPEPCDCDVCQKLFVGACKLLHYDDGQRSQTHVVMDTEFCQDEEIPSKTTISAAVDQGATFTCRACGEEVVQGRDVHDLTKDLSLSSYDLGQNELKELCVTCLISSAVESAGEECDILDDFTSKVEFECTICTAVFQTRKEIHKHINTHNRIQNQACPLCGKVFSDGKTFYAHFLTHKKKREFQCRLCKKMFTCEKKFRFHVKTHQIVENKTQTIHAERISEMDEYQCAKNLTNVMSLENDDVITNSNSSAKMMITNVEGNADRLYQELNESTEEKEKNSGSCTETGSERPEVQDQDRTETGIERVEDTNNGSDGQGIEDSDHNNNCNVVEKQRDADCTRTDSKNQIVVDASCQTREKESEDSDPEKDVKVRSNATNSTRHRKFTRSRKKDLDISKKRVNRRTKIRSKKSKDLLEPNKKIEVDLTIIGKTKFKIDKSKKLSIKKTLVLPKAKLMMEKGKTDTNNNNLDNKQVMISTANLQQQLPDNNDVNKKQIMISTAHSQQEFPDMNNNVKRTKYVRILPKPANMMENRTLKVLVPATVRFRKYVSLLKKPVIWTDASPDQHNKCASIPQTPAVQTEPSYVEHNKHISILPKASHEREYKNVEPDIPKRINSEAVKRNKVLVSSFLRDEGSLNDATRFDDKSTSKESIHESEEQDSPLKSRCSPPYIRSCYLEFAGSEQNRASVESPAKREAENGPCFGSPKWKRKRQSCGKKDRSSNYYTSPSSDRELTSGGQEVMSSDSVSSEKPGESSDILVSGSEDSENSSIGSDFTEDHLKCKYCSKIFRRKCNLTLHISTTHDGTGPYKCDICDKSCQTRGDLKKHLTVHSGDQPYRCDICGKAFSQNSNLNRHMITHVDRNSDVAKAKPFPCDLCDKRFTQKPHMIRHRRVHTGEKLHTCDKCGEEFFENRDLKRHLLKHENGKYMQCTICDEKFTRRLEYNRHLRTHKQFEDYRLYNCNICKSGFDTRFELLQHMSKHTGERLFKCDVCRKSFRTKSDLLSHTKSKKHKHRMFKQEQHKPPSVGEKLT